MFKKFTTVVLKETNTQLSGLGVFLSLNFVEPLKWKGVYNTPSTIGF